MSIFLGILVKMFSSRIHTSWYANP